MTATLPSYVHATAPLRRPAARVHAVLRTDGPALVAEATERAVAAVGPLLQQGRFRRPAAPRVETHIPPSGPAAIRVTWNRNEDDRWPPSTPFAARPTSRWWHRDEEESGWPTVTIDLFVEPRDRGSRIAATSTRRPGTDTSTNRVDRHLRDRIARAALDEFVTALARTVEGTTTDA
jgi:hypothetical protein